MSRRPARAHLRRDRLAPSEKGKSVLGSGIARRLLRETVPPSINAWLAILSLLMTLFAIVVGAFGVSSLQGMQTMRAEVERIAAVRAEIELIRSDVAASSARIVGQAEAAIDAADESRAEAARVLEDTEAASDEAADASRAVMSRAEEAYAASLDLADEARGEIERVREEIDTLVSRADEGVTSATAARMQLEALSGEVGDVKAQLESLSELFNRVAVKNVGVLSAREQQLLFLLGREIDPDSPALLFNAAFSSYVMGRYEEAVELVEQAMASGELPPEVADAARQLRNEAQTALAESASLFVPPTGVLISGVGPIEFTLNVLRSLVQGGYITSTEAKAIIDASTGTPQSE